MSEHKIGEQWVEELDGKKHMLKAVDNTYNCNGCAYLGDTGKCLHSSILECPVYRLDAIIKDLGPVNEDGFLREERSGQYPDISHDKRNGVYEAYLHATLINPAMSAVLVRVQASSMDRLKEAWNRRAM